MSTGEGGDGRSGPQTIGRLHSGIAGPVYGVGALLMPVVAAIGLTVTITAAVRNDGSAAALLWFGALLAAPGLLARSVDGCRFGAAAIHRRVGDLAIDGDHLVVIDSWFLRRPVRLERSAISAIRRSTPASEPRSGGVAKVARLDWSLSTNVAIDLRAPRRFDEVWGRLDRARHPHAWISKGAAADTILVRVDDPGRFVDAATSWLRSSPVTQPPRTQHDEPVIATGGCLDDMVFAAMTATMVLGFGLATAGFIAAG